MASAPLPAAHEREFLEWKGLDRGPRTIAVGEAINPRLRLHLRIAERAEARKLLVLMPAAQTRIEQGQINPLFSRWNWIADYPEAHVVAVSDPSLYYDSALSAAWFLSTETDILAYVARVVSEIRGALEVEADAVLVYGSSLGGFGALSLASMLPGARAIAEIPQIDLQRWPVPPALAALEQRVAPMGLDAFREDRAEQLDVLERFRREGTVPDFVLVTNAGDPLFLDHLGFVRDAQSLTEEPGSRGRSTLVVEGRLHGHRVLPREEATTLIRAELGRL